MTVNLLYCLVSNERGKQSIAKRRSLLQKVAIITDSNSGISQEQAKELGVYVVPMPFTIGEEEFFEGINLSQEQFYEKLLKDEEIATSQPSLESLLDLWDRLLKEYEELVYIPMSSGLSGSCQTAAALSMDYEGKVQVVDNQRISVTLRSSVIDALAMVEQGMNALEIKDRLEEEKLEASIYITVATLKYLKKGGRITPAAAAVGSMLRLKPVLQIQGEKLDAYSTARTMSQAKRTMIDALRSDIETRFGGVAAHQVYLYIAHTNNEAEAMRYKAEVEEAFPGYQVRFVEPLPLSVSCHIGDGALGLGCTKIFEG